MIKSDTDFCSIFLTQNFHLNLVALNSNIEENTQKKYEFQYYKNITKNGLQMYVPLLEKYSL